MGVTDGSPVNAATTNPAFLDANADDTALGKISFNNISDVPTSGPAINNIQREANAMASFSGKAINVAIGALPAWTHNEVGTSSDNLFMRSDALTYLFNGTSGHNHNGTDGNGPNVPGTSLSGIPLQGFFIEGTDLIGVTGTSTNVSTQLTGKTPSTANTILGVVVTGVYNKVTLRYASGTNENDQIFDSLGNIVYGRITESSSVWTLSYYSLIGGTETAYSFSSTNVRWYYQELFNPVVSSPVYSQLAVIPSDNATADILDASEIQSGKVLLSNIVATSVGSSNVKGVATKVSKEDHAHQGLHAVQEFSEAVNVFGDIVLKAGTLTTITRTGQTFLFASTAANPQLSNLSSTAVNASIIPGVANTIDLGTGALYWRKLFVGEIDSGTSGGLLISAATTLALQSVNNLTLKSTTGLVGVDGMSLDLKNTGSTAPSPPKLRLYDDGVINYVGFKAPSTVTTSIDYILPASDGTAGYALTTDGAGNLSWSPSGGGGVLPNDTFFYARNNANTADVPLFKLTTADEFLIVRADASDAINIETSQLIDDAGNISIRFSARILRDSGGNNSLLWDDRTTKNIAGTTINDWQNQANYDESGNLAMQYTSSTRTFNDEAGVVAIRYLSTSRALYNEAGVKVVDFITQQLYDTIPSLSLDWAAHATYDGAGNISFDWENRFLYDANAVVSLDFGNSDRSISYKVFKWFNSATDPGFTAQAGDTYYNTSVGPKYYNGSAWVTFGGANTTLSNLGTTSINADLLPASSNTYSLGSSGLRWATAHVTSQIDIDGSLDISNGFTSPSGASVLGLITTSTTSVAITTKNGSGNTKSVFAESGNSTGGGNTGPIELKSGDTNSAGNSGDVRAKTGTVVSGQRGSFVVEAFTTKLENTVTAGGTTGAQTINKQSGTVNFAAAATSLVVTNDRVTANTIVLTVMRTNDTTAVLGATVSAAGSFTIYMKTAPTAETSVGFVCFNV